MMTERAPRVSKRALVLVGAGVVALLVAGGVWLAVGGSGDQGTSPGAEATTTATTVPPSPGPQPSVAPTNPPTPSPSGPTADVTEGPGTLAPVGLTDTADAGEGISGRLVSVEAIQGDGEGVGNIDGPALRVTVELTNGTSQPLSVAAVAVEMYSGADLTPASPLEDRTARPFTGTLAPGGSATGVYVFTIAQDQRDDVTVQVGYQAGAPYMVFRGSAS